VCICIGKLLTLLADEIFGVGQTQRVGRMFADAVTTRVGEDGGIHCDDVGHGEEGGKAGPHFGGELCVLDFIFLQSG